MPLFLYTDIEGSTQLWENHSEAMGAALDRHDKILLNCVEGCGGRLVRFTGDGLFAVFDGSEGSPGVPLECALAMQRRLAAEPWPEIGELRIRVAVHAGPAEPRAGDFYGPVVNRLARLLATAWGGQIVVTPEALAITPLPEGAGLEDLGVHLLKDLTEPQQIYGLRHAELPIKEFPALRSMSSRPNNLPRQPTPLVGREDELAEIGGLLSRPDCRLLTLVAPGGMGKTRLGLQAAAEQIDAFRHGVFFVPLAGVTSVDNLPSTIANALRFSFYGAEDPEIQLHNYLREKELLLLLDNFEHLISGAGTAAAILAEAPAVKILATSRQRLRLHAEWTFDVPGLPVPENGGPEAAGDFAAVELFVQSARRVLPAFDPSPEELRAIIRVCELVEGMPLALELAAAWVKMLSPEDIAAELRGDLDLLATEMSDVPQRQHSIRAVFEHAWSELSPAEQSAFAQLSVFRGGFTREAAQEVSGANLRILFGLLDQALVSRDSVGRFHVHELLRQYAAEKLDENGERSRATRERQAAYYATFLNGLEQAFFQGARTEPVEGINGELDNILLAWKWAVEQKDPSLLESCQRSLFWFYESKAWYSDGEDAFRSARRSLASARPGAGDGKSADAKERLRLLTTNFSVRQAWFASRLSRYSDARALLPGDVESLYEEMDLEGGWVAAGTEINTLYGMGQYGAARRTLERYDAFYEREHDYGRTWPWSKAQTLANLGRTSGALGDYEKARQLLQEGVDILRPLGDHVGVMLYLHTLGGVLRILGDRKYARQLFEESLALAEAHGYPMGRALALADLGDLDYEEGHYETAGQRFEASLALSEEIGDIRGRALALTSLGQVATALGDYEGASGLFEKGLAITERSGNRRGMAITLNRLSKVRLLMGDLAGADDLCRESQAICQELGYRKGAILALISRGEVALEREECQTAGADFRASLEASEAMGYVTGTLLSEAGLGRAAFGMGELKQAEEHLRQALAVGGEASLPRTKLSVLVTLAETLVAKGELKQGVRLLALAAGHPATDRQTRDRANGLLGELSAKFDASEFAELAERGRSLTLEAAVASLVNGKGTETNSESLS